MYISEKGCIYPGAKTWGLKTSALMLCYQLCCAPVYGSVETGMTAHLQEGTVPYVKIYIQACIAQGRCNGDHTIAILISSPIPSPSDG